ncbi:twin-arginine translocation signal domain-containing protein [Pseudomonas sp. NPDC089401]|uniref:twin-arginine translocation signal domain-containing protein n=1 Tax=Pseudomonas sp. NPDC089401 TaxID=3364462 RepID=UPI0038041B14
MGKLTFFTPLLDRRGFLRNCVLLGAGAAAFGAGLQASRPPAEPGGFVVINGWVLPSQYFRNGQA